MLISPSLNIFGYPNDRYKTTEKVFRVFSGSATYSLPEILAFALHRQGKA